MIEKMMYVMVGICHISTWQTRKNCRVALKTIFFIQEAHTGLCDGHGIWLRSGFSLFAHRDIKITSLCFI